MGTKAKFHGSAFAGLETTERLSDEQIEARLHELLGQLAYEALLNENRKSVSRVVYMYSS